MAAQLCRGTVADVDAQAPDPSSPLGKAWLEAYANFALVVIVPSEVDVVQMVNDGLDERYSYRVNADMTWTKVALLP